MRAICVGVDRVAGRCLVQFPVPDGSDLQPEVIATRYRGDPPAPLTYVDMAQVASGSWICNGSLANVESRLLEDWDEIQSDSTTNNVAHGSTSWQINSSAGASRWATVFGGANQEWGSVILSTPAVSGGYTGVYKSNVINATDAARNIAWWYEARCVIVDASARSFAAGMGVSAGIDPFSSNGGGFATALVLSESASSSGAMRLRCTNGGLATETAMGYTPTAGVPFIVHLMLMGGLWAAAWVVEATSAAQDLDTTVHGPFVVSSNVGTSAGAPGVFVKSTAAASKNVNCDYIRVASVHPVIHPFEALSA